MVDDELIVAIQNIQKTLTRVLNGYKALSKSLDRFEKKDALERQDYLAEAIATLKTADLSIIGCADQKAILCRALEDRHLALRLNAHHNLLEGLKKIVENPAHLKIISDNPCVIYIHPLTLEVQLDAAKATWTYAHETLATTSLDPNEIMASHAQLLDAFRAIRIDPAQFFNCCRMAYEMLLIKNNLRREERVNIVDLLTPLAWLWPEAQQGKKGLSALPRYILAYQFQKLRADHLLQSQNMRIDLGAATGGTTRNKNNVLYIPQGATEGQYYLTICFRNAT